MALSSLGRDVARMARCSTTIVLRVTLAVVVIGVVVVAVAVAGFRGRFVFVAVFVLLCFGLFDSCLGNKSSVSETKQLP